MKCSNLHSKKNKTIKFEPRWDSLEPSLESLQRIHVKEPIRVNTDYYRLVFFTGKPQKDFRYSIHTFFLDLTFDFYKQASQNQQFPKVSGFMPIHSKNTKEWMYLCTACVFVYILHPYMGNR